MNPEDITAWATAVTAMGAWALIWVTYRIECSRRRNERAGVHLQQLRELLFKPLRQEIIEHYLPILERRDGLIRLNAQELFSTYDPLHGKSIEWTIELAIKSASPSIGLTVGEYENFFHYDATFPHLYRDAKEVHFPDLFERWETFQQEMQRLGKKCLDRCGSFRDSLKRQLDLPERDTLSTSAPWVNYIALSLYLYEHLWRCYPNGAQLNHTSGKWVLQFNNVELANGERKVGEDCLKAVGDLKMKESFDDLFQLSQKIKLEAIELKKEFERLILGQFPLKDCPFLKPPKV